MQVIITTFNTFTVVLTEPFLFSECVELRDPHCAWDRKHDACVSVDTATTRRYLIQDVRQGDVSWCMQQKTQNKVVITTENDFKEFDTNSLDTKIIEQRDPLLSDKEIQDDCNEVDGDSNKIRGCAVQNRLNMYTPEYLHIFVGAGSLAGLFVGFLCGYFVSRRFHHPPQYPNSSYIEQHNHLERQRPKDVNLVLNVGNDTLPPKKDNLGSTKNLNITSEGTLQKIKKTYI